MPAPGQSLFFAFYTDSGIGMDCPHVASSLLDALGISSSLYRSFMRQLVALELKADTAEKKGENDQVDCHPCYTLQHPTRSNTPNLAHMKKPN